MNLYHVSTPRLFPGFDWIVSAPDGEAAIAEVKKELWDKWHYALAVNPLPEPDPEDTKVLLHLERDA